MLPNSITSPPHLGKWLAYVLILLTPGSFVLVPVLWLLRHWVAQAAGTKTRVRPADCLRATGREQPVGEGSGRCATHAGRCSLTLNRVEAACGR
jgi:hypothetical protein